MNSIRIGVIGAGLIGRTHIDRALKQPGIELTGIADPSEEGRRVADTWTPAQDGSCKAYGAGGVMWLPTRLRISWDGDRVLKVETDDGYSPTIKEFGEGSENRYHRFTFIADNDEKFTYSFHLDDPAVNYFTHREILRLAMRSV